MASHLGLRSLTMSHLWDARLKWVNIRPGFLFRDLAQLAWCKTKKNKFKWSEVACVNNFRYLVKNAISGDQIIIYAIFEHCFCLYFLYFFPQKSPFLDKISI